MSYHDSSLYFISSQIDINATCMLENVMEGFVHFSEHSTD